MSLPKALCLLLSTACYQVSVIGHGIVPNTWENVAGRRQAFKSNPIVKLASVLCNGLAWIALACTYLSWYLANTNPGSPWLNRLCPLPSNGMPTQSVNLSQNTTLMLFGGTLLCVIGAVLKLSSQRTLGYMYNSSLNLRPAHQLVMHGPYAYIRHPGYSGAILSIVGLVIVHTAEPSYFSVCGVMRVGYARAVWTWLIWSGAWCVSVIVRATKEESVLAERFGIEHRHWRWKVSGRFIPWII